jgi:hypothetical protein
MPISMIATGITRVNQKSGEFFFKVELSKLVVVFICFSCQLIEEFNTFFVQPVLEEPWEMFVAH